MSDTAPETPIRSLDDLIAAGPDAFTDTALGAMQRVETQGRHAILRVTEIEIWSLMLTVHFMGKGIAIADAEARSDQ